MSWLHHIMLVILGLLPLSPPTATSLLQTTTPPPPVSITELPANLVPVPVSISPQPLTLPDASAYAVDLASGQTLYSLHADTQRPIASITKLATALVIARRYHTTDTIIVPALPSYATADSVLGLKPGEQLTVHDLLAALLISSADDAADTLAIAAAGSPTTFASRMNQLLSQWGISSAHFSNPSGLTDTDNGASAHAVAQIAELALRDPVVRQLVASPATSIQDRAGHSFALHTTDDLLQSGHFQGIKTGYTPAAGECFVGLTTVQGHQVITVVLGAKDRFGDTQTLADWINHTYQWQ